jgi:hypothetical protein
MIAHLNLPIGEGEKRYSLVQYSPAGLFRWVENGGMTDKEWDETIGKKSEEARKEREERRQGRWQRGLAMYSKLDELTT